MEEELDRLLSLGIISPVKTSKWAAPIVPENGTVVIDASADIYKYLGYKVDTSISGVLVACIYPRYADACTYHRYL